MLEHDSTVQGIVGPAYSETTFIFQRFNSKYLIPNVSETFFTFTLEVEI